MSLRTGVTALARWAVFFALYVLLADTLETPELITGLVAAGLATASVMVLERSRSVEARMRTPMLRFAYRPFVGLVTDSGRATWALLSLILLRRPVRGRFRVERYTATGDGVDDVARRILTEWAGSVAPNRYVIGIDPEREQLIVHELLPGSGPLDPLELG